MAVKRKIEAMHQEYGMIPTAYCKTCCNLKRFQHRGQSYIKCLPYGLSHGAGTDWRVSNKACGLYNKPHDCNKAKPVIDMLKHCKDYDCDTKPMQGQMSL